MKRAGRYIKSGSYLKEKTISEDRGRESKEASCKRFARPSSMETGGLLGEKKRRGLGFCGGTPYPIRG